MFFFTEEKDFKNLKQLLNKEEFRENQKFILVDGNTERLCLPVLKNIFPADKFQTIYIPQGEENKSLSSCEKIWNTLTEAHADRHSLLLNLGGGMITDIGGFAASLYKRGIPFIHIPTTLLGMVDAAIGGKTGIDFHHIKNHIGTFCEPQSTFIFPGFLATLDHRNKRAGIAEMIKHALIADADLWEKIMTAEDDYFYSAEAIRKSVEIKMKIVRNDPQEKGERKLLNFGHTFGHAFESFSLKNDKHGLLHGEAVAMGMLCEALLSRELNGMKENDLEKMNKLLLKYFDKYAIKKEHIPELISFMKQDKKNKDSKINFSLLKEPGKATLDVFVDEQKIIEVFNWYVSI